MNLEKIEHLREKTPENINMEIGYLTGGPGQMKGIQWKIRISRGNNNQLKKVA